MSKFIYFTPEEKARAQNTDLVSLLRAQGERPIRSGREFRTPSDPSITVRRNKWFDHSARVGGYAISFFQRYYRLPYQEAVLLCFDSVIDAESMAQEKCAIFLIVPEEDTTKHFMASLMVQMLGHELFYVAEKNDGKLPHRVIFSWTSLVPCRPLMFCRFFLRAVPVA